VTRRPGLLRRAWSAYRLRWKRRELLWRCIRAGRQLQPVADRTKAIRPADILLFCVIRNEAPRLREFLSHYRQLGVAHFLFVDNDSTDGAAALLEGQDDVSLWRCGGSYRGSRFGLDWTGALQWRFGHGHWCLTVDADELLIYPDHDRLALPQLTRQLSAAGLEAMGALMLDLYPTGPLGTADAGPDAPLTARLPWFDAGPHRTQRMMPRNNLWVQGGVRERAFFSDQPRLAPTLNKLPLVRWRRSMVYVNSTHSMLPPRLNLSWDGPGDPRPSGVLLHGKFLPDIVEKSKEELQRRQHFVRPETYADYHRAITDRPVLRCASSLRFSGWQQLEELGLMSPAGRNNTR
jgi:glycosyltransferase involved in cell wall biosynthesis